MTNKMTRENTKVNQTAPDGTHKATVKNITHKDNMAIFDVEIIGGIHDGSQFHFSIDVDLQKKNKIAIDTLNILANCANIKILKYPYNELIGVKFLITVVKTNIKKIQKIL